MCWWNEPVEAIQIKTDEPSHEMAFTGGEVQASAVWSMADGWVFHGSEEDIATLRKITELVREV
jgi:hypothetical protein